MDGQASKAGIMTSPLRDTEMEVIYTGFRQPAETRINTALQEDMASVSGNKKGLKDVFNNYLHQEIFSL